MKETLYPILAYIARYWFFALLLVILWRALVWLRWDAMGARRRKARLSDAGAIGEWVRVDAEPTDAAARVFPATRDGIIGSARGCDIRLTSERVPSFVARFSFGTDGLRVWPDAPGLLFVDGVAVQSEAVLRHGATLSVGGITLQLSLFAGIRLAGECETDRPEADAPGVDRPENLLPPKTRLPTPQLTIRGKAKPGRQAHENPTDA